MPHPASCRRVLPPALAFALAVASAAVPGALTAQGGATTQGVPPAIAEIREADLRRDLFAFASDTMRGREGGTLDELRASMWLADQYRQIGLVPMGEDGTYFQWWNIVRTRVSMTSSTIRINGQPLELFRDIIAAGVAPVEAAGTIVWLADPSDTTLDIRGRIVAMRLIAPVPARIRGNSYPEPVRYIDAAVQATTAGLARRGPVAVLLVADGRADAAFDDWSTMRVRGSYDVDRAMTRSGGPPARVPPPPAPGSGPLPVYLLREAMGAVLMGGASAELEVRLERFETPSVNVIGMVRGTDPALRDEYVLYSSHQDANGTRFVFEGDSVFAGADDNGSVTVAGLAAARAFVRQPGRRSVLFINHGAEERGLLGSRYHASNPVVPIAQIVAVLNGDMIGRNHPDSAALLGSQAPHRNSTELVAMAHRANALTGKFVLDSLWDLPTHPEGWYFRSDHVPYARLNIPALMYTTNLHDDYHTPQDKPEQIDYPKLTRMAQWMYLTGWFVANTPKRPALDPGFRLER